MVSVLSILATPSGAAYSLFCLGLLAVIWSRTRPASWWLLAGSGGIVLIFSSGRVAAALMSPLEYAYPTVHEPQQFPEARHIVVLTGWAGDDLEMPLSGRLSPSSAYRILMTLELSRERPDCVVVVSGDAVTARIMGQVLVKLGVPADKLVLENRSRTTADSAEHLRPIVREDSFFLVTSAGHLPRAMSVIEKQRLKAIPAPTDHQLPRQWSRAELHPAPGSLVVSDLAIHEYLGLLWYRLRGRA